MAIQSQINSAEARNKGASCIDGTDSLTHDN